MSDTISRRQAIEALRRNQEAYLHDNYFEKIDNYTAKIVETDIETLTELPSAELEWNNHTVACLLAEMFGEDCACNFNGIDEWLPEKCEVIESCPNPVGGGLLGTVFKAQGRKENRMNDLISRNALFREMEKAQWYNNADRDEIAEELVLNAPTIEPEIIRCRKCKFASGDSRICMKFGHSPIGELDFCAWAERRADEQTKD